MTHPEIELLVNSLDQAYNRRSWHGTNLRGSIRGHAASEQGVHRKTQDHEGSKCLTECSRVSLQ